MKQLLVLIGGVLFLFSCEIANVQQDQMTTMSSNSLSRDVVLNAESITLTKSIDLGIASDYNIFVLDDIEMMWTDALGRVAAAGDITLSGYGVALEEKSLTDEYALVAGGNITYTYGSVYNGNVAYGESFTPTGVSILKGVAVQDTPIDFETAEEDLKTLSAYLESVEINGEVLNQWGKVIFSGSEEVNIFTISTKEIESAHTLDLDIPEGSTAIINVEGTKTAVMNKGMTENFNKNKQNVLFNFPNQTELTIQSIGLKGSVLAPFAALTFQWGNIEGNIIAASVYGSGESHLYPFIPVVVEEETELPEEFEFLGACLEDNDTTTINMYIWGYGIDQIETVYLNGVEQIISWSDYWCLSIKVSPDEVNMNGHNYAEVAFINGATFSIDTPIYVDP